MFSNPVELCDIVSTYSNSGYKVRRNRKILGRSAFVKLTQRCLDT
jgi:hypothetical protein